MCHFLLQRSTLLLLLMASVAVAREPEQHAPNERTLILSEHPRTEASKLYVGGGISTVLRLENSCDPERTRLLGWEGHFEPLVCAGKTVLLYPLRDLTPEDRFLLMVTLTDGTEIPFIVTAHQQTYYDREIDQQVNVFADREGYNAVLASLYRSLESEQQLREENERYRKEENSVDHAYATLLANGAVKQTPFRLAKTVILKDGEVDMKVEIFSAKRNGKAAVVVQIANTHLNNPWKLQEARLTSKPSSRSTRPFALRMNQTEIVPGASGTLAVVVDKSSFTSKQGLTDLALEIFRSDGSQQVVVFLDHRLVHE